MGPAAKYLLGVVPAVFLLLLALIGAPFLARGSFFGMVMVLSAVLGMSGLVWSFLGYSRKKAALVLLLLLIGVLAVLGVAYAGPFLALLRETRNDQLRAHPWTVLKILLLSWLFLGPAVVGLMQAWRVAGVLWKRPPHVSPTM